MHALCSDIWARDPGWNFMGLKLDFRFVSKTFHSRRCWVLACNLCPARAMKYYLRRTSDIRETVGVFQRRLQKGHLQEHSVFLDKKAICVAYEMSSADTRGLHRVST